MNHSIISKFLLAVVCLGIAAAEGDEVVIDSKVFQAPAEYCFRQLAVRGKAEAVILEYNLIIRPEDNFQRGDVFVAASFKSRPGVLLLTNSLSWYEIDESLDPLPYASFEQLQPIVPISVFYEPANVTTLIGEAQIWIGYGIRSETESTRISYEEMIENGRFNLVWTAGNLNAEVDGSENKICLSTTGMTITTETIEANSANGNPPIFHRVQK